MFLLASITKYFEEFQSRGKKSKGKVAKLGVRQIREESREVAVVRIKVVLSSGVKRKRIGRGGKKNKKKKEKKGNSEEKNLSKSKI